MLNQKPRKTALFTIALLTFVALSTEIQNHIIKPALDSLISKAEASETVLVNGRFYTVNDNNKWAEAVAIDKGDIVYVGSMRNIDSYIDKKTKVIDLKGKFAMPAFVDGHMHPLTNSYAELFQVALFDLNTSDKYLTAITQFANKKPGNKWIIGAGFDATAFGLAGPKKEILDKILPDRAIAIVDRDIHSMLVNSKALKLMGITENTPDPVGGTIERDNNGHATGLLIDDSAMNLARGFFPSATKAQYKASLLWMQKWLNREGITTAHDAWVEFDPNYYQAFDELANEGKLTVRYRGSWFVDPLGDYMADIDYGVERSAQFSHPNFQVRSFKFLTDNVLDLDSALLLDKTEKLIGVNNWEEANMLGAYTKVDKAHFGLHVHTVGDGAVRLTLDTIEAVQSINGSRDARHALAHIEVAAPNDIKRMGALGVTAHKTMVDSEQAPEFFKGTTSKLLPVKSLIKAGINVTISSDYATSDPDVKANIYSAITRKNNERVTMEEILKAATINGAYANFLENEIGSLEIGKKGDIVVLSKNLFEIQPDEILNVEVEMTFFEGKRVH